MVQQYNLEEPKSPVPSRAVKDKTNRIEGERKENREVIVFSLQNKT
jgi:hypothetical protein